MAIDALLQLLAAGAALVIYTATCALQAFRADKPSRKMDWSDKKLARKKKKKKPRTRLGYLHLFGNAAMFALSLAHAFLLALDRSKRGLISIGTRSDVDVSCTLFASLVWLIFLLGMSDSPLGAGYEQLVPWTLLMVSCAISAALSSAQPRLTSYQAANVRIQWVRLVVLLLLVASIPLHRFLGHQMAQPVLDKDEETQPLLGAATDPNTNKDDRPDYDERDDVSVKTTLSDASSSDDDEDEGINDEAKKAEKAQRKALRDRPMLEYLTSFRVFLPFIHPRTFLQYVYLTITVLNTLAARAVTLGQPLIYGSVINDLTQHRVRYPKIAAFVALRFLSSPSGISLIRAIVTYRLNTEMQNALMQHCFAHIMSLSADFHNTKSTPSVWQVIDRGNSVVELLQDIMFKFLPVVADLMIALVVVTKLFGAYLCFLVAVTMIMLSWTNKVTMSLRNDMRRNFIDIWRNWYSHMSDSFMHWRTVSEFNKVGHEIDRHRSKTKTVTRVQISQRAFRLWMEGIQEVVVTLGFLLVVVLAVNEIAAGRANVGRFVTLISYWSQIMNPVTTLAGSASNISEQLVDAEKLMLLLEKKPLVTSKPQAPPFVFNGGRITFEGVSFSYDGSRTVTKEVSFTAEPGQTIALVGETGGGKSTIFNLLYRFFDPVSGRVVVDGQDIRDVNLESYRACLGLVPQNPILFNQSIMRNIKYSNLDATTEEVIEASKTAQFHSKVEKFPKKYNQKVGELAQKLSGGELQRLAIARAIVKKPGILLLDEATSAVDSVTESKIQAALDQLREGRTTFVIAHRLSTIINADKILVVKHGEIVESGTHDELLEHGNGAYKELWDAQAKLSAGKSKAGKAVADGSSSGAQDQQPGQAEDGGKGETGHDSEGSSTHVASEEDAKSGNEGSNEV